MMLFRNCIEDCCDGKITKRMGEPDKLIFHRISFSHDAEKPIEDHDLDGPMVAKLFTDTNKYRPGYYTGGQMPYSFVCTVDGIIDQCLPVRELAPHAKRWNQTGLSIAVVGDFKAYDPAPLQWRACVDFAALWMAAGLGLYGHTELPDSSSDPTKECPGERFSMTALRHSACIHAKEIQTVERARNRLIRLGVVF